MRYLLTHLDDAWTLTVIHLRLSLIPIVLGLLIAVPLGALIQRTTTFRRLTTVTASIIFTIPSLALFVVLPLIIPTRILDEVNVIVALTLYTTALLVRAVPEALDSLSLNLTSIRRGAGLPGATRPIEVLQPIQALAQSRADYLDAVLAYNRAQFQLFHALGRPPLLGQSPPVAPPSGPPVPAPAPR